MRKASENKTKRQSGKAARTASKNVEAVKAAETKTEVTPEAVKAEETNEEKVADVTPVEVNQEEAPKATRAKKETKTPRKPRTTKAAKETKTSSTDKEEPKAKRPYTRRASKASESVTLQVDGRADLSLNNLIDRVKAAYVAEGHKESSIKNVEVYVKLSENMAYYVIDGYASGISLY